MPDFTDVPVGAPFHAEITWAAQQGLLRGWPTGAFKPLWNVTREAMAAVFYRISGEPYYVPPTASAFRDVASGHPFYREIHWARGRGLLTGWTDGTFRPSLPIARDATAAMFYRSAGSPAYAAPAASRFKDVRPGAKFYREIHWMAAVGITKGWPDGTFRPLSPTHRDAMAAFLQRFDRAV